MRVGPRDDAQCARCHQEIAAAPAAHSRHAAGSEGARCVNCHMPFLSVERGHGAVTDHTIGIPRPALRGDRIAQDACTWCHVGGRAAPPGAPPLSEAGIRESFARWWPEAAVRVDDRDETGPARPPPLRPGCSTAARPLSVPRQLSVSAHRTYVGSVR